MSGIAAIQIQTAARPLVQSTGQDPMEARWGFQCAVRDKPVDGSKVSIEQFGTGQIDATLPFGKFFKLAHFDIPEEIHSTDDDENFPRERLVTKTAQSAERYLDAMLGGKTLQGHDDPQKVDWGMRFGFYGEEDLGKMAVISATLLPSLPEIRQIAENANTYSPIGDRCEGEDTVGFGERHSCPTCWAQWLDSDVCARYMREVSETGRSVEVTDVVTGRSTKQTIHVSMSELESGRAVIKESLRFGINANRTLWVTVAQELENKKRDAVDAYQDNVRKDLHATKPQDAQMAQITAFAKASNQFSAPVANDPTAGMTAKERAQYYIDLAEFEEFRANKQSRYIEVASDAEVDSGILFTEGQDVFCEDAPGRITEAKAGGWFLVVLENGESKTVRKDKLRRVE